MKATSDGNEASFADDNDADALDMASIAVVETGDGSDGNDDEVLSPTVEEDEEEYEVVALLVVALGTTAVAAAAAAAAAAADDDDDDDEAGALEIMALASGMHGGTAVAAP